MRDATKKRFSQPQSDRGRSTTVRWTTVASLWMAEEVEVVVERAAAPARAARLAILSKTAEHQCVSALQPGESFKAALRSIAIRLKSPVHPRLILLLLSVCFLAVAWRVSAAAAPPAPAGR